MEKIPSYLLKMVLGFLGDKLKKETGYDIMSTDLNKSVEKMSIPAFFIVSDVDKISGRDHVHRLFMNYGKAVDDKEKPLKDYLECTGGHGGDREDHILQAAVDFLVDLCKKSAKNAKPKFRHPHAAMWAGFDPGLPIRLKKVLDDDDEVPDLDITELPGLDNKHDMLQSGDLLGLNRVKSEYQPS